MPKLQLHIWYIEAIQGDLAQMDLSCPVFSGEIRFYGDPGSNRGPHRSKVARSPSLVATWSTALQVVLRSNSGVGTIYWW